MTKQETFKKRIRARMAKTGERYGAARRALLASSTRGRRTWAEQPEMGEEPLVEVTGRGWDDWCDVIEAWPGHDGGHPVVASFLQTDHAVDGWWAQTITVGWERISGRRRKYQRPDGTFTAGKSKTVSLDPEEVRAWLLDDEDRRDLFGGIASDLRSRPDAKTLRFGIEPGVVQISIDHRPDGRAKVSVAHERLPEAEDVDRWKHFWGEWLDAIDDG